MTAAEMERARKRPRHERRDFATANRAAGLERCDGCGWWTNDTQDVGERKLCGECRDPLHLRNPDPTLFGVGTLEHEMACHLAAKETA